LDVTGKMMALGGFIMGSVMHETIDPTLKIKEDQIEAHRKRQREQLIQYVPT